MIKRIFTLFPLLCQPVCAGELFDVSATGQPTQISMTLCLNGKGAISCQNYTASALNLNIMTTIPGHHYPGAGIKINTPGYKPTGCSVNSNGYCVFPVSNTQAATIAVIPITCQGQPGMISFSPDITTLDNPIGGSPNPSQRFTISMTMCNSLGEALTPSVDNPIHIEVYGAPTGVISPTSTTTSTGSVTLTYNGEPFPNNISVNAWISDSTNNGAALGVMEVLKQNTPSCSYGSTSYDVPLEETLPHALKVRADVGHDVGESETSLIPYTIDTGSLGVVVPQSELGHSAHVIGPGGPGVKYYDSSGNTYSGYYYLASVRVKLASGVVRTQPIMVLGINKAYCTGPTTKSCYTTPPTPNLRYLGIGFNRNSTTAGDLFVSPTANAFLHITNASNGTDMSPGYYLKPGEGVPATGLKLGITDATGYDVINLTPNPAVPGDFNPQSGCYSFPDSPLPNRFCGTALLDVGIDYMIIDLAKDRRPAGTENSNEEVPATTNMSILMGSISSPALAYDFSAVLSNPPADTATPTYVQWAEGEIFVNTGRRPLYVYNYFYNGQCGQVGFKQLP